MKTFSIYVKAFFSLIPLGIVVFFLAITILVASISQVSDPFDAALERMDLLSVLESTVTFNLIEMQLQEVHQMFALSYFLPEGDTAQRAQAAKAEINQELAALENDGRFNPEDPYQSDLTAELRDFNQTLASHEEIFSQLKPVFESQNETDQISFSEKLEENQQSLYYQMRGLIISVEQNRLAALQDFPDDAETGVYYAAIGLASCLILALFGYQFISTIVRPLRYLRNAITAIGGDRYHSEIQSDLLTKNGLAGDLSRALDQLARGEQLRNEGIKKEIEQLRQELYESRRRRLKVFHPTDKPE